MSFFTNAKNAFTFVVAHTAEIEGFVKEAEVLFNVPQSGQDKLNYVLGALTALGTTGGVNVAVLEGLLPLVGGFVSFLAAKLFPKHVAA